MNLGFGEMAFIFVIALLIFGPRKLPELGRHVGKALAEFKRASNEFKGQFEIEMRRIEVEETLRKENEALKKALEMPANTAAQTPVQELVDHNPAPQADAKGPNA